MARAWDAIRCPDSRGLAFQARTSGTRATRRSPVGNCKAIGDVLESRVPARRRLGGDHSQSVEGTVVHPPPTNEFAYEGVGQGARGLNGCDELRSRAVRDEVRGIGARWQASEERVYPVGRKHPEASFSCGLSRAAVGDT